MKVKTEFDGFLVVILNDIVEDGDNGAAGDERGDS